MNRRNLLTLTSGSLAQLKDGTPTRLGSLYIEAGQ